MRSQRINLWLHNGHYDVIKSLKGFYATDSYCESCEKPYKGAVNHRCPNACHICLRIQCVPGEAHRCEDCDRLCRSEDCFEAHKAILGNAEQSICDKVCQTNQSYLIL